MLVSFGGLMVLNATFNNIADRHDITEILLKVSLNTIKPHNQPSKKYSIRYWIKRFVYLACMG